jgi:DNA replication ATP-dependent helicase Dna2
LKDDWANTEVRANDVVNLIGTWEVAGACATMVLSTSRNILILHPDLLIPTTSISTASKCLRRPLLSSLVRSSSADVTPSTVWGHILHEVMQSCLSSGTWSEPFISERIDERIRSSLDRLIQIRVGFDVARSEVLKRAKGLVTFGALYISPTPKVRERMKYSITISY